MALFNRLPVAPCVLDLHSRFVNKSSPMPLNSRSNSDDPLRPLRGIVPPLATPLADRDALDHDGLERLVQHLLEGGVHGLFLLGTTGEAVALSGRLRRELIERVTKLVNGRVPVLVGVPDNSVAESLRLARDSADMGASAIVVSTPFYLPLEQSELVEYVRLFDRESPLPILLYNMPRLTSHWFTVEIIREALQLKNIIGLKDSSDDMGYFGEVCRMLPERPDWSLLVGPEERLVEAIGMGAHGCVGGGANIWPQLLVELYDASVQSDEARIAKLQSQLQEMGEIYEHGTYASGVIRGIKCTLELLGICSSRMADPFAPCDDRQRTAIRTRLVKLGLLREGEGRNPATSSGAKPPRATVAE